MTEQKCFLKSLDNLHPSLLLTEDEKIIGRSPETIIEDIACSRSQVSLKPNLKEKFVYVKQLGLNSSALNGFVMERNKIYKVCHGDIVEVMHTKYFYEIVFDPPPIEEEKRPFKRISSSTELNKSDSKKRKLNNDPVVGNNGISAKNSKINDDTIAIKKSLWNASIKSEEDSKKVLNPAMKNTWESIDSGKLLIFTGKGVVSSNKIASYDIDGTIIKTKSGNVFPKNCDDWQIAFTEVPGKLKKQLHEGYKIVFFTNQAGLSSGKCKVPDFKNKIESITSKLNIPIQIFISTAKGIFRKPLTGMWDALVNNKNDGIVINTNESFFVGDAAGRPEKTSHIKRRKDHSLADRLMALNIGITFYTPEEHFQNCKQEQWVQPEFDPKLHVALNLLDPVTSNATTNSLEVIVMVGGPGSGKSCFAKNHIASKGYSLINRDVLKSWQKCVKELQDCLERKKSAVIDNTNGDKETRKRYVDVAKKFGVPCRCFVMATSYKQSKHNIIFREITDPSHAPINDMVINGYKSKYQEPKREEGFSEIVRVHFVPMFKNKEQENLYKMYLLDK